MSILAFREKAQQGFTLIEMMIVVAVIGILAAIAYPIYTEQIAKGRRAQAKAQLVAGQLWMERFYSENYRYDQNSAGTPVTDSTQFPARFSTSPPAGEGAAMYGITVLASNRDSYTITATRIPGGRMASDKCGNFTIDNLGRKSILFSSYTSVTDGIAACWN